MRDFLPRILLAGRGRRGRLCLLSRERDGNVAGACCPRRHAVAARQTEERVLAEIDRLAVIFSGYDPKSEFSRWQAAPKIPFKVSPELYDVLQSSERWGAQSGGAFDPRVEVLSRLWDRCSRLGLLPTHEETAAAKALLDCTAWRTDPTTHTALRLSDCPISLNGIAKGYIVERACEAALEKSAGRRRAAPERRRRSARAEARPPGPSASRPPGPTQSRPNPMFISK